MNVNSYLPYSRINEQIATYCNQKISLDIEEGKMGCCIYFFEIARLTGEKQYQQLAEKLLDDIYSELANETTERTSYELAQIGMGINYLHEKNYVKGNINLILGDLDRLIFKTIVFENKPITYQINGIISVFYYICARISRHNKGSEARFLLEELSIKVFNDIYRSLDPGFFDESYVFSMLRYKLPQFLYVLSKMITLQFYNYRVVEVLNEILGLIQSRIPVLHSNRLYLLWGLLHLKEATGWNTWNEQIDILINRMDYKKMIYEELRNKNVFIEDGVAGIYLLLNAIKHTFLSLPFDIILFQKRIEESKIWKDKESLEKRGLINGISGLLLVYYSIIS